MRSSRPVVAFQGRYLEIIQHNGVEYVRKRAASSVVLIVPVTAFGEIVLIEQFRRALNCNVIEYPAGLVGDENPDETVEAAARRELLEESGYDADELKFLLRGPSSPGSSTEVVDFYFAPNAVKRSSGGGIGHEKIHVHCVPLASAETWLDQKVTMGVMVDPRVFLGIHFARNFISG